MKWPLLSKARRRRVLDKLWSDEVDGSRTGYAPEAGRCSLNSGRIGSRRHLHEVGVGGSSPGGSLATAHPGTTATADADTCTCDPRFFPDALDADCPLHGLAEFWRGKVYDQEADEKLRACRPERAVHYHGAGERCECGATSNVYGLVGLRTHPFAARGGDAA